MHCHSGGLGLAWHDVQPRACDAIGDRKEKLKSNKGAIIKLD